LRPWKNYGYGTYAQAAVIGSIRINLRKDLFEQHKTTPIPDLYRWMTIRLDGVLDEEDLRTAALISFARHSTATRRLIAFGRYLAKYVSYSEEMKTAEANYDYSSSSFGYLPQVVVEGKG
jgi:hypothetical protein